MEGYARLRDGKKWKTRWLVLRKPSPVADCLVLLVFKDKSDKAQGNKERASVTLEEICGLETGQWYEGVAFTLAILCLNQAALLGFDSKEALLAWDARLRYSLGSSQIQCCSLTRDQVRERTCHSSFVQQLTGSRPGRPPCYYWPLEPSRPSQIWTCTKRIRV